MGCATSKEEQKQILGKRVFQNKQGLCWDGLALIDNEQIHSLRAVVIDGGLSEVCGPDGKAMLRARMGYTVREFFVPSPIKPTTGDTVLLLHKEQMQDGVEGAMWALWAAKPAREGQKAEPTVTGSMMYRWGRCYTDKSPGKQNRTVQLDYYDSSSKRMLSIPQFSELSVVARLDPYASGHSVEQTAAVVEGLDCDDLV